MLNIMHTSLKPDFIVNMLNGRLFYYYRMPSYKTLATKQMSDTKGDKTQIILAMCANADGLDIIPPLFLGHAH